MEALVVGPLRGVLGSVTQSFLGISGGNRILTPSPSAVSLECLGAGRIFVFGRKGLLLLFRDLRFTKSGVLITVQAENVAKSETKTQGWNLNGRRKILQKVGFGELENFFGCLWAPWSNL